MKITVQNEYARKNIELFKHLLEKHGEEESSIEGASFLGFLNCMTGELHFQEASPHAPRWKAIFLRLRREGEALRAELVERKNENFHFSSADLHPFASKAVSETIEILNCLSGTSSIQEFYRALCSLELEGRDIIAEAWYDVDRLGAESLLLDKPEGTFLFRKDEFALLLEQELSEKHQKNIKCMTLSSLEPENQVIDRTLIWKDNRVAFYDDDPDLDQPFYENIFSLLSSVLGSLHGALSRLTNAD